MVIQTYLAGPASLAPRTHPRASLVSRGDLSTLHSSCSWQIPTRGQNRRAGSGRHLMCPVGKTEELIHFSEFVCLFCFFGLKRIQLLTISKILPG